MYLSCIISGIWVIVRWLFPLHRLQRNWAVLPSVFVYLIFIIRSPNDLEFILVYGWKHELNAYMFTQPTSCMALFIAECECAQAFGLFLYFQIQFHPGSLFMRQHHTSYFRSFIAYLFTVKLFSQLFFLMAFLFVLVRFSIWASILTGFTLKGPCWYFWKFYK